MLYEYQCPECKKVFDVVKHHSMSSNIEGCPDCSAASDRIYSPPQLLDINPKPEYNAGLGCWVKDKHHRREVAKRLGVVEVGNEPISNLHRNKPNVRDYDA